MSLVLRFPLRQALRSRPMLLSRVIQSPLHTSTFRAWNHSSQPSNQPPQQQSATSQSSASTQVPSNGSGTKRHDPLAPAPRRPVELDAPRVVPQPKRTSSKMASASVGPVPPRGPRAPEVDAAERLARGAARMATHPTMVQAPAPEKAQAPTEAVDISALVASEPIQTSSSEPAPPQQVPTTSQGRLVRTWSAVRDGAVHYYHGTKEMYRQLRVSGQLIRRQLLGYDLTRRERGQIRRTRGDLLRLIPFVPFVIIPFAELLLPVAVKMFPRMLPSTFEPANAEAMRALRAFHARADAAQTVARVLSTHALPPKAGNPSVLAALAAVRAQPDTVDATTVIKASQAFDDDSVLISLPRSALVAMAQFLSLASTGTFSLTSAAETAASLGLSLDGYLRFTVRRRLTALRSDDIVLLYSAKGYQHLDKDELPKAARERGIDLTVPVAISGKDESVKHDEALRAALHDWVLLHVEHRIAPTILVLASAVTAAQGAPDAVPKGQTPRTTVAARTPEHLSGYPACLHTLLIHTPGGLDTRQSHTI